ncbi:tail fiber domain-containing protein [Pararcticibacter amylolyticus]|uniref:DNA topoisomerase IV n=1 Tax=Pararcticibacter amylolyticus TaxID=2173175 RepID=A0A2U2PGA1_9SPHI|nr:tail fiber domain-containing protein [Pararcticibacter amylolyticus]PWG80437.1 DNA topoisomerase IV [Pararcticibacter amylolyticus]
MNTLGLKTTVGAFTLAILLSAGTLSAQTKKTGTDLRTDVQPITNSLSKISQLEPLTFKYKQEDIKKLNLPAGLQYGFIPEDVQRVLPEVVKNESKMIPAGKNAFKTTSVKNIDLEALIPVLVGSIKEQQAEIEALKKEIQSLKSVAAVGN